jgi:hypothetical protein
MPVTINGTTGIDGPNASGDTLINGVTVGTGAGDVSTNTVVGSGVMGSNTSGNQNTVVGFQAGFSNTTSSNNTFIGRIAGYSNSTSSGNNTFVGNAVGYFTSTGQENTAVGGDALQANTTGNLNTAIGRNAGNAITTGSKNTILGSFTGNQNTVDIRTASNRIVLSDGDGNPRRVYDNVGNELHPSASYVGNFSGQTWITVVNVSTLGGTYAGGRIRCYANENGSVNTSYTEFYFVNSSNGAVLSNAGTQAVAGNNYATLQAQISSNVFQVRSANSSSAGAWNVTFEIFRPGV